MNFNWNFTEILSSEIENTIIFASDRLHQTSSRLSLLWYCSFAGKNCIKQVLIFILGRCTSHLLERESKMDIKVSDDFQFSAHFLVPPPPEIPIQFSHRSTRGARRPQRQRNNPDGIYKEWLKSSLYDYYRRKSIERRHFFFQITSSPRAGKGMKFLREIVTKGSFKPTPKPQFAMEVNDFPSLGNQAPQPAISPNPNSTTGTGEAESQISLQPLGNSWLESSPFILFSWPSEIERKPKEESARLVTEEVAEINTCAKERRPQAHASGCSTAINNW